MSKKLSDKQLDKEIAKEKKNWRKVWKKRLDVLEEIALVVILIVSSVYAHSKGLFEIPNEHIMAMVGMLVVVAVSLRLIQKRI